MSTPGPYRPSTTYSTASKSNQNGRYTSTEHCGSRSGTARPSTARPGTAPGRRSRATSHIGGEYQTIICALNEARGITPTVGLAFINISTGEAVLSQICDNQFYAKTLNKIQVFEPSEILIATTSGPINAKSNMYGVIEENITGVRITILNRKYWAEVVGLEFISRLAFLEDAEAIKQSIGGNYFATCCFAAALKYIENVMQLTFASHSLRIKYQPSEGTMMIDLSTIHSLELIQNIQNAKSKHCLLGLMNETLTPMGCRLLRSSILQPTTQLDVLMSRYDAITEMSTKEDMFMQTRQALKQILDAEKLLSSLIVIPTVSSMQYSEQSINNILKLKSFIKSIPPLHEALIGATSLLLVTIQENCRPECIKTTLKFIEQVINNDVMYQKKALDLRNQRTYAVKSGVCGLLDVARQSFKEATEDVHHHVSSINRGWTILYFVPSILSHCSYIAEEYEMQAEMRYESGRRYFLRIPENNFDGREIPNILVNRFRKNGYIEFQTIDLMKLNQKIEDSHQEVVLMSDKTVQALLDNIRGEISNLFRVCESVALLDMIAGLVQLATTGEDYIRPEITECIAIKSGRHPVKEKIHTAEKFVSNDVFATKTKRFQIITGCNMSGKSTYLRSVALMSVMAQVGSFVPASYASFPIIHQIFARVSLDDSIEANVSTFAAEMRETAFILRNIDKRSLAIIDELGRGTSTRDGLAIALSIAEALVDSKAMVFFATHFRELAQILNEREGVVNLHLTVEMKENSINMLYKLGNGYVKEEHYGLALARVMNLPPKVLEAAEKVSRALEDQIRAKKQSSKAVSITRKRKLLLELQAHLGDLLNGSLTEEPLRSYLKKLQNEFVSRMEAIDRDARGSDDDEEGIERPSVEEIGGDKDAQESTSTDDGTLL